MRAPSDSVSNVSGGLRTPSDRERIDIGELRTPSKWDNSSNGNLCSSSNGWVKWCILWNLVGRLGWLVLKRFFSLLSCMLGGRSKNSFLSREQPNVKVLFKSRGEKFGYIKKVGKKALWHRHSPWRRKVIRSSPAVASAASSFRIKRKTYVPLREVTLVDTQQVVRTGLDSFAEFDFISPELVKELELPVERRSVCMVEALSRNEKIRTFVKAFEIELYIRSFLLLPLSKVSLMLNSSLFVLA